MSWCLLNMVDDDVVVVVGEEGTREEGSRKWGNLLDLYQFERVV